MPGPTVKIKVTEVKVKGDSSVKGYARDTDGLKGVWKALKEAKQWRAQGKLDRKKTAIDRIIGVTYPDVGGHPGHVHVKGWKYNIERGNGSVDRLVVEDWAAEVTDQEYDSKKKIITAEVKITAKGRVLEDTH